MTAALTLLVLLQVWPACPADGRFTSRYGRRIDPITRGKGFHDGIDIANVEGTPVFAPWAGVVQNMHSANAGRHVVLTAGDTVVTLAHLSRKAVPSGARVEQAQMIGYMGSTGRATGSHLHLSIKVLGRRINPFFAFTGCMERP